MKRWETQDLGELTEFLCMHITHDGRKVHIDQSPYLHTVLKRCGMQNTKAVPTPLLASYAPTKSLDRVADLDLQSRFQTIIGSLLYFMLGTRPNIAFAVTKLAQFAANLTQDHLDKVLCICPWLKHKITIPHMTEMLVKALMHALTQIGLLTQTTNIHNLGTLLDWLEVSFHGPPKCRKLLCCPQQRLSTWHSPIVAAR